MFLGVPDPAKACPSTIVSLEFLKKSQLQFPGLIPRPGLTWGIWWWFDNADSMVFFLWWFILWWLWMIMGEWLWWPDFDGDLMDFDGKFFLIHGKSRNGKKSFSFSSSSCTTPEMVPLDSLFASQVDSWSRVHGAWFFAFQKGQKPLEHELSWKMIVTYCYRCYISSIPPPWKLLKVAITQVIST